MKKIRNSFYITDSINYFILASFLFSLLFAILMGTYKEIGRIRASLFDKLQIVAFTSKNMNYAVVNERLQNTEGVQSAEFVSPQQVLEQITRISPQIKDMIVGDQNPFSAHFIVHPEKVSLRSYSDIKNSISRIDGLDGVKYDEEAMRLQESHASFLAILNSFFVFLAAIIFTIISSKLLYRIVYGTFSKMEYLRSIVYGSISGLIGFAAYYLLNTVFTSNAVSFLVVSDAAFVILSGITAYLVMEN